MNTLTVTVEKERPILMKTDLVVSSFEGTKTQTLRPIIPQPGRKLKKCPWGQPGDFLWVRETCQVGKALNAEDRGGVIFPAGPYGQREHADNPPVAMTWARQWKKTPSIHMPRWACRLRLEILETTAMRLHDLTEAQAKAEGVKIPCSKDENGKVRILLNILSPFFEKPGLPKDPGGPPPDRAWEMAIFRIQFAALWDDLYGKTRYRWKKNPWCWRIRYKAASTLKEDA